MITGIVVALTEELSTLTQKRLEQRGITHLSEKVWLIYSGTGDENARIASELLVEKGVDRLISWGCAAALHSALRPGHIVLAESCIDAQHTVLELRNKDWINGFRSSFDRHFPMHVGMIAESLTIVETSADKISIRERTGAIALDMESTAIAKVANDNNIPFLTIRAIADSVNMGLPKAVSHAIDANGKIIIRKLLIFLLLHPAELRDLVKLGLAFNAAKKTLKRVARDIDLINRFGESELSVL